MDSEKLATQPISPPMNSAGIPAAPKILNTETAAPATKSKAQAKIRNLAAREVVTGTITRSVAIKARTAPTEKVPLKINRVVPLILRAPLRIGRDRFLVDRRVPSRAR